MYPAAVGPNTDSQVSQRLISEEPMAMVRFRWWDMSGNGELTMGSCCFVPAILSPPPFSSHITLVCYPGSIPAPSLPAPCRLVSRLSSAVFLRVIVTPSYLSSLGRSHQQIINFGMSNNFQTVNFDQLKWPAQMLVDYVRVYQRSDGKMGCDPSDRPTANYIANHANAYNNPNLTTWEGAGYSMPVSVCGDGERGDLSGARRGTAWRVLGLAWRKEERGGRERSGGKQRGGGEQSSRGLAGTGDARVNG
jgi:hypothetical protein